MTKFRIIITFVLLCLSKSNAQDTMEKGVSYSICRYLYHQNEYFLLKSHLEKYVEVYFNDTFALVARDTVPNLSNKYLTKFRSMGPLQRGDVFSVHSLPIFPITDTIYIVDSSQILAQRDISVNNHYFKIVENISDSTLLPKCIFLRRVKFSKYIMLFFSFYNNPKVDIMCLDINKEQFNVVRNDFIDTSKFYGCTPSHKN